MTVQALALSFSCYINIYVYIYIYIFIVCVRVKFVCPATEKAKQNLFLHMRHTHRTDLP